MLMLLLLSLSRLGLIASSLPLLSLCLIDRNVCTNTNFVFCFLLLLLRLECSPPRPARDEWRQRGGETRLSNIESAGQAVQCEDGDRRHQRVSRVPRRPGRDGGHRTAVPATRRANICHLGGHHRRAVGRCPALHYQIERRDSVCLQVMCARVLSLSLSRVYRAIES